MCQSRYYASSLDTLPSFLANFSYQSNSPIICGFMPEAYAQPWLGFTAWILHASHLLRAIGRPRMFWRRLSSRVQEVVQSPQREQVHPPPLPQHPHRLRKMLMHPRSLLPLQSALHPNADTPSPLLRNAHSLTPLRMRSRHQGTDQKVVVQAHWVHPDQVLSLAVAVGPAKGPQLDLKPAQVRDWPTHEQHRLAASKSFLEMRPVEMMMMPCTLPTRQMCLKAVCPFLISLSLMMRILTNAKHVSLLVKVTPTSRRGKTNSLVMEWRVCKNGTTWWTTMLIVGRGSPKIPTSLAPCLLYGGTWSF